ncbi:hypothetical protein Fmac_024193 [Flemingia macrophylla]|uniref:Uncharacterized protein n=1 Tax=Flemingia macrophylla TaxID=520843 RepID=A0ABD1LNP2_9FABA
MKHLPHTNRERVAIASTSDNTKPPPTITMLESSSVNDVVASFDSSLPAQTLSLNSTFGPLPRRYYRRNDIAKDCDVEAPIVISVSFSMDSLTMEEIEANVISNVRGSDDSILSEHKGLVETAYWFFLYHDYMNFGITPKIKTLKFKPFKGSELGTVIVISARLVGLVIARQLEFDF